MEDGDGDKALRKIGEAFKEIASAVNSQTVDIEVAPFSHACSLVSPLFGCLGIAFKFAEMDYVAKVNDLAKTSSSISTLSALLDHDIEGNCVRKAGSNSRNLLRVKRGLDMVRVLFEHMLASEEKWIGCIKWCISTIRFSVLVNDMLFGFFQSFRGLSDNSLRNPASTAYAEVLAPHHGWAIRKAVAAGMYVLPTKAQLLARLNEDEATARIQMQNYINASAPVILYINKLFLTRELGIDW